MCIFLHFYILVVEGVDEISDVTKEEEILNVQRKQRVFIFFHRRIIHLYECRISTRKLCENRLHGYVNAIQSYYVTKIWCCLWHGKALQVPNMK